MSKNEPKRYRSRVKSLTLVIEPAISGDPLAKGKRIKFNDHTCVVNTPREQKFVENHPSYGTTIHEVTEKSAMPK